MNRHPPLDALLEWLEAHIDPGHVSEVRARNRRAIRFEPVDHVPLAVWTRDTGAFQPVPRELTFGNPELMLYNELLFSFGNIPASVLIGDDSLYQIRSNQGVGIVASLFGAATSVVNGMPWVSHLEMDALKKALSRGVPSSTGGLGARVFEDCAYFRERLGEFPKCAQAVHITQPDLQGPFDNAHLLMGNELFYSLYDDPELAHELLALVAEVQISFVRDIEPHLTGTLFGDSLVVHGSLYGGRALIKDDTAAINLSEAFYREFSAAYNHRIGEALGGASLHHCGVPRDWHFGGFKGPFLRGINYGQPQLHDFADKLRNADASGIPVIGWGHDQPYGSAPFAQFYAAEPRTGLTLSCLAETLDEGRRAFEAHLNAERARTR